MANGETLGEEIARTMLVAEMLAEGLVEKERETLIYRQGKHTFMVELKLFEVTGE